MSDDGDDDDDDDDGGKVFVNEIKLMLPRLIQ